MSCLFRCALTPYSAHQAYEPDFRDCSGTLEKLGLPWPPINPYVPGQFEESRDIKNGTISSLVSVQLKISARVWDHADHHIDSVLMLSLVFFN